MLLALLMAVTPWLEMSGGPSYIARRGNGPMARVEVGVPLGDRFAAEGWISGLIDSTPLTSSAVLSTGVGGRMLLTPTGRSLGLWAHAGAGWSPYIGYGGRSGPTGFAGAILAFQPFLKRFSLGLEADASVFTNILGADNAVAFSFLPYLRCSF